VGNPALLVKSGSLQWSEHAARMGGNKYILRFVGKRLGNRWLQKKSEGYEKMK
jgi:hypothetical protein